MITILWIIGGALGIFILLSAYLYFNQKNMVFFPDKNLAVNPAQLGLEFEEVYIDVEAGQRLHGWYFPADSSPDSGVFLFCHGNAGNISHRIETIFFLRELGASVLIFDYRGYGLSDGTPSEDNIYADANTCYEWLTGEKNYKPERIFIFGRSLGGAAAVDLAARVPCGGLIVESSFTSAAAMARRIFPIFPTALISKFRFDSEEKISRAKCPVVVIHSPDDDMIPFEMGRTLYERANQPKLFLEISGNHNDRNYLNGLDYQQAFKRLLGTGM